MADPSHTEARRGDDGRIEVRKRSAATLLRAKAFPAAEAQRLAGVRDLPWRDEYAERLVQYWASDERVDAHGDIVRQNWNFTEYETNPVLCWSHQWGGFPIGNSLDWQVRARADKGYSGQALWLLTLFATREQFELADQAHRLVAARFLRAGSVGFYPGSMIIVEDEAERSKLGLGRWGVIHNEPHLLEFSPTMLGANSGALTLLANAKRRGALHARDFGLIRELARGEVVRSGELERWREVDGGYVRMGRMLFPDAEFPEHTDPEEAIVELDEDNVLRHYVPGTSKAADEEGETPETLEDRVESLRATLEEGLAGVAAQLDDIRTLLEEREEDVDDEEAQLESAGSSGKGRGQGGRAGKAGGRGPAGVDRARLRSAIRRLSDAIPTVQTTGT